MVLGMTRMTAASGLRRLASISFVAILTLALVGPASVTATSSSSEISALERSMVSALNANRTALGLVPLQIDPRLMTIARARSADMVANNYFSHTLPDGRNVFKIVIEQQIKWYGLGEIIAANNSSMDKTLEVANRGWMNSPGHRAIVISPNYNYFGVGLAVDDASGRKVWTAVYMRGPDRTGARALITDVALRAGPTATTRYAKVSWKGWDPQLQVLTAGLDSFVVQRRIDNGAWLSVAAATTLRYTNFRVGLGHLTEFRVAARDKAGNVGVWSVKAVDLR